MQIETKASKPLETETPCLKWTYVSADGSLSAHYEHTVAILSDGPEILTCAD